MSNDIMDVKKKELDNRLKGLAKLLSFKGSLVRFYASGKKLYLKTTECLYQIIPKGINEFRLKIMRKYAKDNG